MSSDNEERASNAEASEKICDGPHRTSTSRPGLVAMVESQFPRGRARPVRHLLRPPPSSSSRQASSYGPFRLPTRSLSPCSLLERCARVLPFQKVHDLGPVSRQG